MHFSQWTTRDQFAPLFETVTFGLLWMVHWPFVSVLISSIEDVGNYSYGLGKTISKEDQFLLYPDRTVGAIKGQSSKPCSDFPFFSVMLPKSHIIGHPMKPHRVRMCHSLVTNYGLYKKMDVIVRLISQLKKLPFSNSLETSQMSRTFDLTWLFFFRLDFCS